MSVDHSARKAVAQSLEDYLSGKIDNFTLDDTIIDLDTSDKLCIIMSRKIWCLYDDLKIHKYEGDFSLTPDKEKMVVRWIRLLRSDIDWNDLQIAQEDQRVGMISRLFSNLIFGLTPKPLNNLYWPCQDENEWDSLEPHCPFSSNE